MTIYRKPNYNLPIGDVDGPDQEGFFWARVFGTNERVGPYENQQGALVFLVRDAGASAEFYVDGGPKEILQ